MNRAGNEGGSLPVRSSLDDASLTLRHIRADDTDLLMSFVNGLSFAARYFRFGRGDIEFSAEDIRRTCTPDPDACVHFVVERQHGGQRAIIGSARIVFAPGGTTGELAISVGDAWQGSGVGDRLVRALIDSARTRGLREIHARILATNRDMIDFMRGRGFAIADSPESAALKIARITVHPGHVG